MSEVPNTFLALFWGYAAFFGLLTLFIGFLAIDQLRLRKRISELQEELNVARNLRSKADPNTAQDIAQRDETPHRQAR